MIVRSTLIGIITIVILATPVTASDSAVNVGIKGGINLAGLESDIIPSGSDILTFSGGLSLATSIQPSIGVDLDLLYVMKGAADEYVSGVGELNSTAEYELQLSYLVISPLLRLAPGKSGAGFYMLVGPEMGVLLNADMASNLGGVSSESDWKDEFKTLDWAVTGGVGFQTSPPGQTAFFVEGRYSHGLSNIMDNSDRTYELETTTRGVLVMAGLRF